MNSSIKNRKQAFETNFALEEEQDFKAKVMASKLLGLWVAKEIKLSESDTASYCKSLVELSISNKDHESIINKAFHDLEKQGLNFTKSRLESIFLENFDNAKAELGK